jgi:hypothetical protein
MEAVAMPDPSRNEQEAIARRAYEIWEAEGRPHGRDREHWEAAARELGSSAPMPKESLDGGGLPALEAAKKPARSRKPVDPAAPPKPRRKTAPPA